jgi:hypothetical protein
MISYRGKNMNDKESYHDLLEKIEFRNTLNASGISNIKDQALELKYSFSEFEIVFFKNIVVLIKNTQKIS